MKINILNLSSTTTLLVITCILMHLSCDEKSPEESNCSDISSCLLEPDPGPCFASITRYYYDVGEQKCKEFTWGGCGGVVPFETLEECQESCECEFKL